MMAMLIGLTEGTSPSRRMRFVERSVLAFTCVATMVPLAASAQVLPVGSEFRVNDYTTGSQFYSAVAMGPAGGFVVVWESFGSSGTDTQDGSIQAQRIDQDGVRIGSQFQVNTYTTGSQRNPTVAIGPGGEFVVAWDSIGSSGTDDLYESVAGQRFDSDGLPIGTEFQVNTYTTEAQLRPFVATGPRGEFVVAWESYGSSGTDNDVLDPSVHAQRFGSDGLAIGTELQVNTYTTDNQLRPSVAIGPTGEFVVVWDSIGSSGTDNHTLSISIQGQRFGSDGSFVGTEFQVNTYTTDDQARPSVAMGPAGEFVVVWESGGSGGTDHDGGGILGQQFRADGIPIGTEFQVNTYTTSSQSRPAIAMGVGGAFVVTWEVFRLRDPTGDFFDVKGQRFQTTVTSSPCADADANGVLTATDALIALQASVGSGVCGLCRCDTDASGTITATDALRILRRAVGQPVALTCPAC